MSDEALAQVAYTAYGDCRDWKVFSGDPMPTWDEQQEDLKQAWIAAAHAVAVVVEGEMS
jgi:hypothetical protein